MVNKQMNKLAELLRKRMDVENLSLRETGEKIGVSHSTVARIVDGETVEVDTLVKICDFLNIPVETVLDIREEPEEILQQVVMVLSIEPELSQIFGDIARGIINKEVDRKVLSEIAAFASYRLEHELASGQTTKVPVEITAGRERTLE